MDLKTKLQFYLENDYNVLLCGRHGTGKTTLVKEVFEEAKLNWKYFSAATMDPWVDFVGIPKEVNDENGSYLDLIRPKEFRDDNIHALFFDELNRATRKVKNSVLELIQFKSINGKKFNNLKVVWAAINPDDEELEYDVEKLDPAQKDRFHIFINIPYAIPKEYFSKKFGDMWANSSTEWWNQLPDEVKKTISPRRLDYALDVYRDNGDIRDVIGPNANVGNLITVLNNGPIQEKLKELISNKNDAKTKEFFELNNNYNASVSYILKNQQYLDYFYQFFPKEELSSLISENNKMYKHIVNNQNTQLCKDVIKDILDANLNKKLIKKLNKDIVNTPLPSTMTLGNYFARLTFNPKNTNDRKQKYSIIKQYLPKILNNELLSLEKKMETVNKSLSSLADIANHSNPDSMDHFKDFSGLLNQTMAFTTGNSCPIEDAVKLELMSMLRKHESLRGKVIMP